MIKLQKKMKGSYYNTFVAFTKAFFQYFCDKEEIMTPLEEVE
jgi:hypothetical protein